MADVIPTDFASEDMLQVNVVTRETYNNRELEGSLSNTTMYFIKEPYTNEPECLSLALGGAKQTDIININDMLKLKSVNSSELKEFQFEAEVLNTPVFKIPEKLYIYEDPQQDVAKAFVYSPVCGNSFIPLYGAPIWEEL